MVSLLDEQLQVALDLRRRGSGNETRRGEGEVEEISHEGQNTTPKRPNHLDEVLESRETAVRVGESRTGLVAIGSEPRLVSLVHKLLVDIVLLLLLLLLLPLLSIKKKKISIYAPSGLDYCAKYTAGHADWVSISI